MPKKKYSTIFHSVIWGISSVSGSVTCTVTSDKQARFLSVSPDNLTEAS